MQTENRIYLPDVIGKGYGTFWRFKGRYRIVKGSRASKKSKTMALWIIVKMMEYPQANTLVVRQVKDTLKDSCFTELKWAIHRLGVDAHWKTKESPLQMEYLPTGQKIYFRGLDDPLKLTSITVDVGCLCWVWIEEAYQIQDEKDFNTLNESIRGEVPFGLFKQITMTFNPWSNTHWIKKRFFDAETDPDILTMTTNYLCNEWLDAADWKVFEDMRKNDLARYRVAGLGEWGIDGGIYFPEFNERIHVCEPFVIPEHWMHYRVFDYGLDMLACYWVAVDEQGRAFVYDELYKSNLIISDAAAAILAHNHDEVYQTKAPPDMWNRSQETGKSKAEIFSENGIMLSKAINDRVTGWLNVKEWLKPTVDEFGQKSSNLKIFSRCRNLIRCLPSVQPDEKNINDVAREPHELTHSVDALRYFCAGRLLPAIVPVEKDEDVIEYDDEVSDFINYGG